MQILCIRGAEAGGILGVKAPHFLALHPPLFRAPEKMEVREGVIKKFGNLWGVGKSKWE